MKAPSVRPWITQVKKWLQGSELRGGSPSPFGVACTCGHVLRGVRRPVHQVARCPKCGQDVFVLPTSPWPAVAESQEKPAAASAPGSPSASRQAVRLGGLIALAVVLALASWALYSIPWTGGAGEPRAKALEELREAVAAGQRAMRDGNFQSAVEEFDHAAALLRRHPGLLPAVETSRLQHLQAQANLLADLLTESLEEILHRLEGQEVREGQAAFARRYRGKSVVFFSRVRRDAAGRYEIDYHLESDGRPAHLDLGAVKLLQSLPLQAPELLLFGVRLEGVRRENSGGWLIQLQPASGILITDLGAAEACCFAPLDRDSLPAVLQRQAAWLREQNME
jgi:hypothetical protein